MQVVEDQDHRRITRRDLEQARDRAQQQIALGLRVGLARLGVAGHPGADLRGELRELPAVLLRVGAKDLVRRLRHVVPEGANPWAVRDTEVLVAAAVQHRGAVAVAVHGQLGRQAGLPDPRLARYERDAAGALAHLVEKKSEPLALHVTAHIADRRDLAQPRRQRQRVRGVLRWLPVDLVGGERLREALQIQETQRTELVPLPRRGPHEVTTQDLAAGGGAAETRGLDHRRPEVVALLHVGLAHRDPDANRELLVGLAITTLDALLHLDGGAHGRRGAGEDHHQPVAYVLDLAAAGRLDGAAQDREVVAPQALRGARADTRGESGRPHEVREQDRAGLERAHGP